MTPTINLFIGNHSYAHGIEDIVEIVSYAFAKRDVVLEKTTTLTKDKINVVIDEFSSETNIEYLLHFRKGYPSAKIVLIASEFCASKMGLTSFNLFGGWMQWINIAHYNRRIKRTAPIFGKINFHERFLGWLASPIFYILSLQMPRTLLHYLRAGDAQRFFAWRLECNGCAGMHRRYLGLKRVLGTFDACITLHPYIAQTYAGLFKSCKGEKTPRFLGNLLPEFDQSIVLRSCRQNKRLGFEVTGSLTPYREEQTNALNKFLTRESRAGNNPGLKHCIYRSWNSADTSEVSALSFHPKQTQKWRFSSPTRIYRAIQISGNIPVTTQRFKQCITEDLCLLYEPTPAFLATAYAAAGSAASREEYLSDKLERYSTLAEASNNDLIEKIKALLVNSNN